MKAYIETDMEGVAGVLNFHEWTDRGAPYYEEGKELLTLEVNAAVDGLLEGGATEIHVSDGHGPGGISIKLLDPRVELSRVAGGLPWPGCLDGSYDFIVWVGQHAKACTPYGHLCHTQSLAYIDESVNGLSIGEFGEMGLCASELGVRAIFGSGDLAFTREAQALVPGIETVAIKQGLKPGTGENLDEEAYGRYVDSVRHLHPERVRLLIREGALRAIRRAQTEDFGIIPIRPPFRRVIELRPATGRSRPTMAVMKHATSFIGVMNTWGEFRPIGKRAGTTERKRRIRGQIR